MGVAVSCEATAPSASTRSRSVIGPGRRSQRRRTASCSAAWMPGVRTASPPRLASRKRTASSISEGLPACSGWIRQVSGSSGAPAGMTRPPTAAHRRLFSPSGSMETTVRPCSRRWSSIQRIRLVLPEPISPRIKVTACGGGGEAGSRPWVCEKYTSRPSRAWAPIHSASGGGKTWRAGAGSRGSASSKRSVGSSRPGQSTPPGWKCKSARSAT